MGCMCRYGILAMYCEQIAAAAATTDAAVLWCSVLLIYGPQDHISSTHIHATEEGAGLAWPGQCLTGGSSDAATAAASYRKKVITLSISSCAAAHVTSTKYYCTLLVAIFNQKN